MLQAGEEQVSHGSRLSYVGYIFCNFVNTGKSGCRRSVANSSTSQVGNRGRRSGITAGATWRESRLGASGFTNMRSIGTRSVRRRIGAIVSPTLELKPYVVGVVPDGKIFSF